MIKRGANRKGQITIFVIISIVLVGSISLYFLVRNLQKKMVDPELAPAYENYLSCLKDITRQGVNLMEEQAGYIYKPDFVKGSYFMPFSSELDFFGVGVPYWMYISGNNILKEQVPSKSEMENQLERYIVEHIQDCDFSEMEKRGYLIEVKNGKADVEIRKNDVRVSVTNPMRITKGNKSKTLSKHSFVINSALGKFYDEAIKIYNYQKENAFLEKYALDVLRLYAPVTGVELSCAPLIFSDNEIKNNLSVALENNIQAIKVRGNYYKTDKKGKYFVVDPGFSVGEGVNFFYSRNWPTRIEIYGKRVVTPVGIQQGLGILGFCYVPYHLVYDIDFPVMIQLYDNNEIFQFPVSVIISRNQARKALLSSDSILYEDVVCKSKNKEIVVESVDEDGNPVEANVQFKCLRSICSLGKTELSGGKAVLKAKAPECVNGFVIANAEGYAESKTMVSTNRESSAKVVLRKKYKVGLDLGKVDKAVVYFDSEDYGTSVLYPDMKDVELIEGNYSVVVYAYKNSSIFFPAVHKKYCFDVPEKGVLGMFGKTRQQCIDINIPETEISMALVGGGKTSEYITRDQLKRANELNINVPLFKEPENLEELQQNQISVEDARVYLEFE